MWMEDSLKMYSVCMKGHYSGSRAILPQLEGLRAILVAAIKLNNTIMSSNVYDFTVQSPSVHPRTETDMAVFEAPL